VVYALEVDPREPDNNNCANAPAGPLDLDGAYMNKTATVAGEQLVKAGFRLASLLSGIWLSGARPRESALNDCSAMGLCLKRVLQSLIFERRK